MYEYKSNTLVMVMLTLAIAYLFFNLIFGIPKPLEPKNDELPFKAGYFITSDRMQSSFYITRMVDEDGIEGDEGVCFIQRQIPSGFFENCITIKGLKDVLGAWNAEITKEAKYVY